MRHSMLTLFLGMVLFSSQSLADYSAPSDRKHNRDAPLAEVQFNLVAEKWVKTQSAKVTVNLHATVRQDELANIHNQILSLLKQLADKGDWHLTTFNRSQDRSGLERIYVVAEARLDESMLSDLNRRAKKLSQEGRTLTVQDIQFKPTLAETEMARSELRGLIYEQIKGELAGINKIYPSRRFEVKEVDFQPTLQPMLRRVSENRMFKAMAEDMAGSPGASLEVSDKVVMSANVVIADKLPLGPRQ